MTPFLAASEAIHSPGAVTCAILQDLGWRMGDGCLALFFSGLAAATASLNGDVVLVAFEVEPGAEIDSVIVEAGRPGEELMPVATVDVDVDAPELRRYEVEIPGLEPGNYQIQLRIVDVDRLTLPGPELAVTVPLLERHQVGMPYPNPVQDEVHMSLMVRDSQRVTVEVFDALGRRIATLLSGMMNQNEEVLLRHDVRSVSAGTYFIHVTGENFRVSRPFVRIR